MSDATQTIQRSTDLFSFPSFLKGASRVVDLFGKLDEYKYDDDADTKALKKDWEVVGQNIKESIDNYATTQTK